MKYIAITLLLFLQSGCSSSTDNTENSLIGTWVSNCHERIDSNGVIIPYSLKRLTISEGAFEFITIDQIGPSCTTASGVAFITPGSYTLSEKVTTTDGVPAQRITLNSDFNFFAQPIKTTTEKIYRVTGVELNFGEYIKGVTPSLDYAITYIKQ